MSDADQEGLRHRRRRDGRRHRRAGRQCRRAGAAARHRRRRTAPIATRSPKARSRRCSRPIPRPSCRKRAAKLVETGNIEDDLGSSPSATGSSRRSSSGSTSSRRSTPSSRRCARPARVVSSNTSTIPLGQLVEGLPDALRARLPDHPFLQPAALHAAARDRRRPDRPIRRRCDDGRRASPTSRWARASSAAKDTPGFIANRIGTYWLQIAVNAAIELGPDRRGGRRRSCGRPMGIPKTGVFGLLDLVGLDLMPHVNASLARPLPQDDPYHATGATDAAGRAR